MDIEKLIEQLKYYGTTYAIGDNLGKEIDGSDELMLNAATDLSTLQAENEKLRAEVNRLEYERDYPCIYFKAGGLCRYGGDESEANICVMGPCEVETTAEYVDRLRAELEQVKRERDAAVKDMEALMWFSGEGCHICAHEIIIHREPYVRSECALGNAAVCCPTWRGPQKEG